MKTTPILAIAWILFLVIYSCTPSTPSNEEAEDSSASSGTSMTGGEQVYCFTTESDTVILSLDISPDKVRGTLLTQYAGKDKNTGAIAGQLHGDTLFADYTFQSEGVESIREVAFILRGDKAMEGYGDVIEGNGKMVFASRDSLAFDSSFVLSKGQCR